MRELGGMAIYYNWAKVTPGTEIKGTFERTRIDNYDKTNWVLRSEDGQEHVLNHCGSLARKMGFASRGQELLIKYDGTEPVQLKKYGLKDVHQFKVFCLSDPGASVDDIEDEYIKDLGIDNVYGATARPKAAKASKDDDSLDSLDSLDDDDDDDDRLDDDDDDDKLDEIPF